MFSFFPTFCVINRRPIVFYTSFVSYHILILRFLAATIVLYMHSIYSLDS